MKRNGQLYIISLIFLFCLPGFIIAGNSKSGNKQEAIQNVYLAAGANDSVWVEYPDYQPWSEVTLQGKLKMRGLPLSPSLKIFMKKDELISVSVRAPFIGEAARMEITPDTALVVNKINKTYVKEGIKDFLKYYPGDLGDVQDLLLARFFLPGFDVMEADLDSLVEVVLEEGQFNVVPIGEAEIEGVKYGFVVDEVFQPRMLIVIPENRPDVEIGAFYKYYNSGYDLQFVYQEGEKAYDFTLELKNPEWKGEMPKPIELEKKYKQLSLGDFMRSISK